MLELLQTWNGLQGEHVEADDAPVPQDQQMVEKWDCPQLGHLVVGAQFPCPTFFGLTLAWTQVSIRATREDQMLHCCIFGSYIHISAVALQAMDAGFALIFWGCFLFIHMCLCKCFKSHCRNY